VNQYRELLRDREFALLWSGATVSALGDGMSFVALIWLLIERGGSASDVGWLAAVYTAPVIVGGIVAGIILDRFDPRRVIAADNIIRGIAIGSVPIAAALGQLTTVHLFVVAAIYGLLFMTSIAGIPSLITRLVGSDRLTTANAMESITYGIAGLVGPALAGVVIALVGAPVVLALDALTYGVFVVCLLAMRREGAGMADQAAVEGPSRSTESRVGAGIGPAVRFIVGAPAIVATTLMSCA
jgi:MFS family permease